MFIFPHKIYVDGDNNIWVVDGRGINERERKAHPAAEGVAVDARGNVYGGEVGPRQLVRHAK